MKLHRRRNIILFGTSLIAALLLLIVGAWRLHKSQTIQLFGQLFTSGPSADSVVALTFDDGPVPSYTDSVLELLREENVSATFFVVGKLVARSPELARRIVNAGHELGNHSYSHHAMVLMRLGTIRQEVESTDSLIRAAGFAGPIYIRPPYGKRLVGLPWYLSRTNRTTVLWTLEPDSWFHTRAGIVRHVIGNVHPGSIILLHVEVPSRVEERAALPLIIRELKARAYRFVVLSELMVPGRSAR